ncbi:DNA mismatch repair endonuclease MutL [Candidatus Babeliales bacterium]|nr:DNA mismatch repair endonuclease MutL [Candidatus Babeliales bacterium]
MARIRQLPPHEAHKIAAGEVAERPANVLKELLENALDAKATSITVHIEEAGKKLIRVVDNGHGMHRDDAQECFKHHATSKIMSIADLPTIATYGFRGEALSSIAAVSTIILKTKEPDTHEGTHVNLNAGVVDNVTIGACETGTDIAVQKLFYNVPARHKFLKIDATEWRHMLTLFQAYALAHPPLSFKLTHNGTVINICPATTSIQERAQQVLDTSIAPHLIPLQPTTNQDGTLTGVISSHHYARYDRNAIYLFVNKRWIKNLGISRALLKGYLNVLQPGRYPAACICLDLPPQTIDVNIHPRKEEIKLLHPKRIESMVTHAVTQALEMQLSEQLKKTTTVAKVTFNFDEHPFRPHINYTAGSEHTPPPLTFRHVPRVSQTHIQTISEQPQQKIDTEPTWQVLGQAHKTYIILEHEEGIYLLDQHAAHERILYEQFAQRFGSVATVQLLFPTHVTLPPDDCILLMTYQSLLHHHGIIIDHLSSNQIVVTATPVHAKSLNYTELLKIFVSWIHEHKDLDPEGLNKIINEKLHAQMACKAAIKAGDELTHNHMQQLVNDLNKTSNRFSCPHGRPTGWLLTTHDIEKKFKRRL